jgi:hypothetical protein
MLSEISVEIMYELSRIIPVNYYAALKVGWNVSYHLHFLPRKRLIVWIIGIFWGAQENQELPHKMVICLIKYDRGIM